MRGLIVAALLATLMSSLDSVLNGASSLMVNDFIKTSRKEFSEKTLLRISRGLVVLFMAIAVAWAPVILGFDTIVEYFQSFLGYVTMPVVVVLVGGIFWKRATKTAAFWTLVTVAPLGLLGFITGEILELHPIQFLYATGIMVLLSLISFIVISLSTPAPEPAAISGAVFDKRTWAGESRQLKGTLWFKNYRWMAAGVLVLTVGVVVPFI